MRSAGSSNAICALSPKGFVDETLLSPLGLVQVNLGPGPAGIPELGRPLLFGQARRQAALSVRRPTWRARSMPTYGGDGPLTSRFTNALCARMRSLRDGSSRGAW